MSTKALPHVLALMLAFGITTAANLAHANGRTIAQACVERDDCSIDIWPGDSGAFTIILAGGGVIYCPSLNGQCVVVSPDHTNNGNRAPVAKPISGMPVANAGPNGGRPVGSHPIPPRSPIGKLPVIGPVKGWPVAGRPIYPISKPVGFRGGSSGAPVLLARRGHR
jgi:hypothetical protein